MSDPMTAREALIIEAIGDAAALVECVAALTPEVQRIGRELDCANSGLRNSLAELEAQVAALTEKAKAETVKHIVARTDEVARHAVDTQAQSMANAAKQLFNSLVDPRLQQLARVIAKQVERIDRPWERWWTHAATALASSSATLAVVAHLWPR
jgi:hypothetical protein